MPLSQTATAEARTEVLFTAGAMPDHRKAYIYPERPNVMFKDLRLRSSETMSVMFVGTQLVNDRVSSGLLSQA